MVCRKSKSIGLPAGLANPEQSLNLPLGRKMSKFKGTQYISDNEEAAGVHS